MDIENARPTLGPPAGEPAAPSRPAARGRLGWYTYDWANSVFTTTVTTVFFGPYLTATARDAAGPDGFLHVLGVPVHAESFYPFVVALSVILQVFVLPAAAGLAARVDRGLLLATLSSTGALTTAAMYTIGDADWALGGALYVVATIALGASITVADAYLPAIAPPELRDRVSTQASAAGYLGGALVLVAGLVVYSRHDALKLSEAGAVRLNLLAAGLWWLVFGLIAAWLLRGYGTAPVRSGPGALSRLRSAVRGLRGRPAAVWFLIAFFLYNNGVQSLTALAGTYAVEQLGLSEDRLVLAVLLVQVAGVAGAVLAGRAAGRFGGTPVLLAYVSVFLFAGVAGAFLPAHRLAPFLGVTVLIGLALGGLYALSRSVFAALVPAAGLSEYFALFEMVNRCLGFAGPAAFGLVLQAGGGYRLAGLTILLLLAAGGVVLALARTAARREGISRV